MKLNIDFLPAYNEAQKLYAEVTGLPFPPEAGETIGTDTIGTDTIGTDTIGTDTIGTDTIGTDTIGTENDGQ